jgi:NADH-quinone oxidoreductase subunit L
VIIGYYTIDPLLFGSFFDGSLVVLAEPNPLVEVHHHFHDPASFAWHGFTGLPFLLVLAGGVVAWYLYLYRPALAEDLRQRFAGIYYILINKYGFDEFYQAFFAGGCQRIGTGLWKFADAGLIDGVLVNGSAALVGWFAGIARRLQTGYLYTYAFAMIIGLLGLLSWFVIR